jgi:hypothetical protein
MREDCILHTAGKRSLRNSGFEWGRKKLCNEELYTFVALVMHLNQGYSLR